MQIFKARTLVQLLPGFSRTNSTARKPPFGVAFIVGQLGLGGAEQQLYHLLSGLERSLFRPVVINLGPQHDEYWEQPIRDLGVSVWHVPHSLGRPGRIIRIASLLGSERVQLVHSWDLHTNPYAAVAGRLAGIPLRLGSMRLNYEGIPSDKLVRWTWYRGLDLLVTNSVAAADQVQELRLTRADVHVVPNGVSIPEPINQVERDRLRSELGFSETDSLIGSIGRIDDNKNYAMLLRAFAPLAKKWPTLRLVIIGDGSLKFQLAAMAEGLGLATKINLPGIIPLAARYLPAMEVCCLTSYTEGMPNLIMESSAAGIPVVSTNCGGSVELIERGVTGYLVSPDDHGAMWTYLDSLLANPCQRHRMGQAAREKMLREFGVSTMVTRMTQIYEQALMGKSLL